MDTPEKTETPEGRTIIVCPAQTREDITCATCGLCARADRRVIIGFRAHGSRARVTDALARRVIPILKG
jgi:polyferredoxin